KKSRLACNPKARISLVEAIHESPLQAAVISFPPSLFSHAPVALCGRQAGRGYEEQYPADACGVPLGAGSFVPIPCQAFIKNSINYFGDDLRI
ncbi:MAG: hypothetical protein ACXWM6_17135, partial [Thermodesulfobacteriota bacterium]